MTKVIVSSDVLKKTLKRLGNAINEKSALPILCSILCKIENNKLSMAATDLEITITEIVDCEIDGTESFLLPYKLINQVVGFSNGLPIIIVSKGKNITITSDGDTFKQNGLEDVSNFPNLPEMKDTIEIGLDPNAYKTLQDASLTVDNNINAKTRNVLLHICKDKKIIASSDSIFIVYSNEYNGVNEVDKNIELHVPVKAIKALNELEPYTVSITESHFLFSNPEQINSVCVTNSKEKFVNYVSIFPLDWPVNLKVNRKELMIALEKCSINSDPFKFTMLEFKDKTVTVVSEDKNFNIKVNIPIAAVYEGDVDKIGFNSDKMMKLLKQVDFETIDFAIHNAMKVIVLTNEENKGYKAALMPSKII
jgi:DNA polymerase III subunit beta